LISSAPTGWRSKEEHPVMVVLFSLCGVTVNKKTIKRSEKMDDVINAKRPILAIVLAVFLVLKMLSGWDFVMKASGPTVYIVALQLLIVAYVVFKMNTRGGGIKAINLLIALVAVVIILDLSIIGIIFSGKSIPKEFYPQMLGAELIYILTMVYLYFSKKLKAFKAVSQ
jgi:hypothetical protein